MLELAGIAYVDDGLRGASVISVDHEPMESFGSFTPHRAGKRSVQGLSLIHIGGPTLTIQGPT